MASATVNAAAKTAIRTVAVIGGSGFGETLRGTSREVTTPFGKVNVLAGEHAGKRIFAIKRHGKGHTTPPHKVNYKANIWAARDLNADVILASTAVGVIKRTWLNRALHALLNQNYAPGDLVSLKGIIAYHLLYPDGSGPITFFLDEVKHTDCSEVFSARVNRLIQEAARLEGIALKKGAVLGGTYGPRYETPEEILALRVLGAHIAGMTACFEAILARELGLPYAPVAIGTNWAAGMGGRLSHDEVVEMMGRKGPEVSRLLMKAIEMM